ncbi:M20 family metallo-hydrolase [Xanthovirga aplysinae]|uniref:M20 family metallo-hydrolase n=1 Tax=Xanthovirga aplysinae TaxID=2529853 RepID=UPI0012BCD5E6|nr:M20 family metallo-hydrolase [Xanthovirga aplysinae]MTI32738.1 M20/M25/M40 family metallo-hydrolase [Xanthovirga aplysinae]
MKSDALTQKAIGLLKDLIAIPSLSKMEEGTAQLLENFFSDQQIPVFRSQNNVWVKNQYFDPTKPSILLNSHHDTVKPNAGYTLDPFTPSEADGKLYGLGSNDAGGPLVAMIATFLHFYDEQGLGYNLILAATAEEEISGEQGVASVLENIGPVDFAIVGEPTLMQMATAEKGLMVLDCVVKGKSGHAAREEGENAIYKALEDIHWFKNFHFEKQSEQLGPIKMTATIIEAGSQHNVVPDSCHFCVDVRTTDAYTNEEVLEIIQKSVQSEVNPRSFRLQSSSIAMDHPIVKAGVELGISTYGSPTTSDQAVMPFSSLKMGPGDSARSHTADEFIYVNEIEEGIGIYINLLEKVICR